MNTAWMFCVLATLLALALGAPAYSETETDEAVAVQAVQAVRAVEAAEFAVRVIRRNQRRKYAPPFTYSTAVSPYAHYNAHFAHYASPYTAYPLQYKVFPSDYYTYGTYPPAYAFQQQPGYIFRGYFT